MRAYLASQGSWIIIEHPISITLPTLALDGSNHGNIMKCSQQEAKAQGSIRLHLNVEFSCTMNNKVMAKDPWEALQTTFGGSSDMGAFSFFKAAINIHLLTNKHPATIISRITGNINELHGSGLSYSTSSGC